MRNSVVPYSPEPESERALGMAAPGLGQKPLAGIVQQHTPIDADSHVYGPHLVWTPGKAERTDARDDVYVGPPEALAGLRVSNCA
jgi:hypothetical protein